MIQINRHANPFSWHKGIYIVFLYVDCTAIGAFGIRVDSIATWIQKFKSFRIKKNTFSHFICKFTIFMNLLKAKCIRQNSMVKFHSIIKRQKVRSARIWKNKIREDLVARCSASNTFKLVHKPKFYSASIWWAAQRTQIKSGSSLGLQNFGIWEKAMLKRGTPKKAHVNESRECGRWAKAKKKEKEAESNASFGPMGVGLWKR